MNSMTYDDLYMWLNDDDRAFHVSELDKGDITSRILYLDMLEKFIKDGVIEKMFIEPDLPGDPFEVSDADTMLDYINPKQVKPEAVSLFTKPGCPFCKKAKALLEEKGLVYEEITMGAGASLTSLKAISGRETVPQVFIGGKHIGGSDDLEKYFAK